MKSIYLIMFFCIMASMSYAEEETLLNRDMESGYYAGLVWKMTRYNGEFDALVGGRVGWIINHSFAIGVGGYGMMSGFRMHGHGFVDNHDHGHKLGYGGLEFEYILNSDKLLHYSLSALLGAGSLDEDEHQDDEDDFYEHDHNSNTVLVFEPSVNGILNINPWLRMCAGISYRFVNGDDIADVDSNVVGGPAATLTFKFGKF